MAFDPLQEDCLRLVLNDMRAKRVFPLENPVFIQHAMEAFQSDPARFVRTDKDRSFHLTARAAQILDYRAPFVAEDTEADKLEAQAASLLAEAVELDSANWDAQRMLASLDAASTEDYLRYLIDNREAMEHDLALEIAGAQDPYGREYARDLAHRPRLRWLAALSSTALIAGKYGLSLSVAEESLVADGADPADVRHTAVLAMAKLERSLDELKRFCRAHAPLPAVAGPLRRRHPAKDEEADPWALLAELCLRYRSFDYEGARCVIRRILRAFPHAAEALSAQTEFPEGVYSRVCVQPGSEDELMLAISEATPLLQEGQGSPDAACLSWWISNDELVTAALGSRAKATPGRGAEGEN